MMDNCLMALDRPGEKSSLQPRLEPSSLNPGGRPGEQFMFN